MNAKADNPSNRLDVVKWLIVVAIVLGGVYANTYFAAVGVFYRALAGIGIAAVAAVIALQTDAGRAAWNLAKEARVEVRKVVWPTRQETTQTTLIVVLIVFLVGLMLWGIDSGLSWGVQAVIG
jgi:preprotein translocase subunit SecE